MTEAVPLLEVRGLSRRFGGLVALDDVSLSVAPGEIHAVIGPNGSGKTTLFNVISGVYPPSAGEIRFGGSPVAGLPPERLARLGLARTFQNTRLFGSMSVLENVLVVRHRAGWGLRFSAPERRRALEILDFVGLADASGQDASVLPQGLRRLLEIAKALALDPKLVLLDEPHGGLNHAETDRLIEVMRRMHKSGLSILLIEHEMQVVMNLAQQITVLNFGRVLAKGPPDAIQKDEGVIEAYLGRETEAAKLHATAAPAPVAAEQSLLSLRQVSVSFGDVEAVRDVSLDVRPGEFVALLGNNGAGKSTTLKAIARLVPARGEIVFGGRQLLEERTERLLSHGVAVVPERRRLFGGLTVVENPRIGAHGKPRAEVEALVEEILDIFPNLKRLRASLAFSLSGGEQQMLAIGRALMSRPRLILLDEPLLGLAPLLAELVFSKLVDINRQGASVLLVEQNARMALSVAHRAYVLSSGRIVAEGSADEIISDPRLKSAYLGMSAEALHDA